MQGWDEERYCSKFEVARLLERTGAAPGQIIEAYLSAWNDRPSRAEPLIELARLHRQSGQHAVALLFAEKADGLPRPADILFVDASAYRWRAPDELSLARYWTGDHEGALQIALRLLHSSELPDAERPRIEQNIEWFRRGRSD
jgi:hypothetical protein